MSTDWSGENSITKISFRHLPGFLKSWKYWFLVSALTLPGATLTALFLYHGLLAEQRGWSMIWMASGFVWFAASQIVSSLIGGELLDRFGVQRAFGVHLLPLAFGLFILSLGLTTKWLLPIYLMLAGVTVGLSSPLKTALLAEAFGTARLATVRSWASAVAVLSTAISPVALGFMLDAGYGFFVYLRVSTIVIFSYSLVIFLMGKRIFNS